MNKSNLLIIYFLMHNKNAHILLTWCKNNACRKRQRVSRYPGAFFFLESLGNKPHKLH